MNTYCVMFLGRYFFTKSKLLDFGNTNGENSAKITLRSVKLRFDEITCKHFSKNTT